MLYLVCAYKRLLRLVLEYKNSLFFQPWDSFPYKIGSYLKFVSLCKVVYFLKVALNQKSKEEV